MNNKIKASTAVLTWTGIEPGIIQPIDVAYMNVARLMHVFKVVVVARKEGHIIRIRL